jgi:hypothetical protein
MPKDLNQIINSRWKNVRYFASVIRSPESVRSAFEGQRLLAWWWRLVLALHGKPMRRNVTAVDRYECIAGGFRFYGWIYRMLGILFGATTMLCWNSSMSDFYWITLLTFGGVYLWAAGGLAISGAKEYCDSQGGRVWLLVAFLFFIALFLAVTLAIFSSEVKFTQSLPDALNIVATLGILGFGVGSYLIELAALVANKLAKAL